MWPGRSVSCGASAWNGEIRPGGLGAEARASIVVASALSLVAVTLTITAINDLAMHSLPEHFRLGDDLNWGLGCRARPLGMGQIPNGKAAAQSRFDGRRDVAPWEPFSG